MRGREFLSAYRTLIYLGVVSATAGLAYAVVNQSALPPYVQELGFTAHIGLFFAVYLIVETIFKSPMGSLGDKLGQRPLIVASASLSSATAFGMTAVSTVPAMLTLRAFDGLACAAIWPTMTVALSGCVGARLRTTAISVMTVTYVGGLAVGPLLGGLANDLTQSRLTSFYLAGGMFLLTAVAAYFLVPHRSEEGLRDVKRNGRRRFGLTGVLLGMKSLPDMMLIAFTAFFAIGLLVPIIKLFAMNELGMSETAYGGLVLPIALVVAAVSLVSGRLGDSWGKTRSVRLGITISAVAMWTVALTQTPVGLAVSGMFLGAGFVLAMPAWLALVSEVAPVYVRGTVIGALGTAQGVGAIAGAAAGSYLYQMAEIQLWGVRFASAHYSPFVFSAFALTACAALTWVFVNDRDKRRIRIWEDG